MPSSSAKQARLMRAVAHNPAFAKKVGISQSVGKDFAEADKGRKFGSGGTMKESKMMMKKEVAFMKKKGAPKSMIKHEEKEYGMKRGGMARGGDMADKAGRAMKSRTADKMGRAMVKMASGGSVGGSYRRAADGVASKGKTKGKMVKMNKGGYC